MKATINATMKTTRSRFRVAAAIGLCVAGGGALHTIGFSSTAQAQDSASVYAVQRQYAPARQAYRAPSFFGFGRQATQPYYSQATAPAPREQRAAKRDKHPAERMDTKAVATAPTRYCVRQCDGFYFPLAGSLKAQASACQDGQIYTAEVGGNIDTATNAAGAAYSAMPNAFAFRSSLDSACVADGGAAVAVYHDPTLRAGDMVMTDDGLKVFRGGSLPHSDSDFRSASSAKLSARERAWIAAVDAATARHSPTPSETLVARLAQRVQRSEARAIKASAEVASAGSEMIGTAGIRSDVSSVAPSTPVADKAGAAKTIRYVGPDLTGR